MVVFLMKRKATVILYCSSNCLNWGEEYYRHLIKSQKHIYSYIKIHLQLVHNSSRGKAVKRK